jgi:hypothetical protein
VLKDNGEMIAENEPVKEENNKIYGEFTIKDFIVDLNPKKQYITVLAVTQKWEVKQRKEHIRYLEKKFKRVLTRKEIRLVYAGKL